MGIIENRDAQFMLLAGFIIAIGLVVTTVMLNNIIFQTNIAGEAGADPLKYEIVNLMQITRDEVKSAYRNVTSPGQNALLNFTNFSRQMQNFNGNLSKLYAMRGGGVNASWNVSNWENARYANFTENGSASGKINWTVMESVKNISVFELRNVSGKASDIDDFTINITNQTTGAFLWSMELENGDTDIRIKNPTWSQTFNITNYSYINLLNPSYKFNISVGSNYKISFYDTKNRVYGRYRILGNTTYGRDFIRARDYVLNANVTFYTSRLRADITIPVSIPW